MVIDQSSQRPPNLSHLISQGDFEITGSKYLSIKHIGTDYQHRHINDDRHTCGVHVVRFVNLLVRSGKGSVSSSFDGFDSALGADSRHAMQRDAHRRVCAAGKECSR